MKQNEIKKLMSESARIMGRSRSPKKLKACRENLKKSDGRPPALVGGKKGLAKAIDKAYADGYEYIAYDKTGFHPTNNPLPDEWHKRCDHTDWGGRTVMPYMYTKFVKEIKP